MNKQKTLIELCRANYAYALMLDKCIKDILKLMAKAKQSRMEDDMEKYRFYFNHKTRREKLYYYLEKGFFASWDKTQKIVEALKKDYEQETVINNFLFDVKENFTQK